MGMATFRAPGPRAFLPQRSSPLPGGYMGRLLRVDLTSGATAVDDLPEEPVLRRLIGGEGLGAYILLRELPPNARALGPESVVVWLTGPLTGTGFTPGGAKATAVYLSPMTGYTLGMANTAGFWGVALKAAGYDGLIITGASPRPVYLFITEKEVSLRDASGVWGQGAHATEELLRQEVGLRDARVAAIGPAGENLVSGAMVVNDYGHNAAHGLGAVFGSKKLKAIVVHGTRRPPVHDRARLIAAGDRWRGVVMQRTPDAKRRGSYGASWGAVNKSNWRSSLMEPEDTQGFEANLITLRPCFQCNVLAPWNVEIGEGPHKGLVCRFNGGSEVYDSFFSLGIKGNDVLYLWDRIDDLGIECAHFACGAGLAFEAYEKELLSPEQTGGLKLQWGDVAAVERLLEMTARRQGWLGNLLADGPVQLAEALGGDAPNWVVHVKGGVPAMHEWRPLIGETLRELLATGGMKPQGGGSVTPPPDLAYREKWGPLDPRAPEGWAQSHLIVEECQHFMGIVGACWHAQNRQRPDGLQCIVDSLNAATGWDFDLDEALKAGHRAVILRNIFDARHGWIPEDDWAKVGPRFLEPISDGQYAGFTIAPFLPGLVQEYYRLSGRHEASGRPLRSTLEGLGLEELAQDSHERS